MKPNPFSHSQPSPCHLPVGSWLLARGCSLFPVPSSFIRFILHPSPLILLFLLPSSFFLSSCAPTVHINTPEPLKVDVNMRIDVYQRAEPGGSSTRKLSLEESKALQRRDERSAEIWAMKNDGVVVEGKNGCLEVHPKSGWDAAHVKQLVEDENNDRRVGYQAEAQASARPLSVIEEEAGQRLRQQAYGGKEQE